MTTVPMIEYAWPPTSPRSLPVALSCLVPVPTSHCLSVRLEMGPHISSASHAGRAPPWDSRPLGLPVSRRSTFPGPKQYVLPPPTMLW